MLLRVVRATRYGIDGPGIESRWGEIFRTGPKGPWGPLSLQYNGYGYCVSSPGVEWSGRGVNHLPQSSVEVKERVEL